MNEPKEIFRYEGQAYNRPCGRGLCLGVDMEDLSFMIPSGDFEVSIVVRRRSDEVGEQDLESLTGSVRP